MTATKERIPQKQLDKVSKFLSFVLRHKPDAINLKLDAQGWAEISDLIEKASSEMPLTAELIERVVATMCIFQQTWKQP